MNQGVKYKQKCKRFLIEVAESLFYGSMPHFHKYTTIIFYVISLQSISILKRISCMQTITL